MLGMISLAVTVAAVVAGYLLARDFVQRRLRYVDAIHSPMAPWLAGLGVALAAWPVALLPLVTTATTTLFGVAAGVGTAQGVRALQRGTG